MKDATLNQAAKILTLFGDAPCEQIQALLASGLLADLRDANVAEVNRDAFRKLVGLKPLTPSVTITIDPAKPFVRDMAREGWTLESDLEYRAGAVTLGVMEFLRSGESSVKGVVMAERSKKLGADFGQNHAEALLENQHLIPKEWRGYYLVFPGTVWQDSSGDRDVPYLGWGGRRWRLDFGWLGGVWRSDVRLLRPCK